MNNLLNNFCNIQKRRKIYKIMRLSVFIATIFLTQVSATVYSHNEKFTIQTQNTTMRDLFHEIEQQSEFRFFYNDVLTNVDKKISLDVKNKKIDEIMNLVLANSGITYRILDNNLVVVSPTALLQQTTVTGLITDADGEPIPGANVVIKGTLTGVVTDMIGKFEINVPNADAVLQISFVGFVTQEIRVGNQQIINVTLLEDTQELEEVVVVGYGVQRKSDVTGSISVATAEDILASPSFNALQGLKGKAAGVNIFNGTGNPLGVNEDPPRVVIRGMNSINTTTAPLYVVDGVQMNEIQFINPNDIERMEVLKDASATAIYGARGANGVILITTKRGDVGEGTTVSYSGWLSVATLAKKVDLMNTAEFMEMEEIAFANIMKYPDGQKKLADLGVSSLAPDRSDPRLFDSQGNPLYDTDWQKEATRNAVSQSHQLNIQHQNKKTAVGAFLNYTDMQGLVLNNYVKRISGRLTYDTKPTNWLDINSNLMVSHSWGNGIDDTGGGQSIRRTIWEMPPIFPVKFPDGTWSNSQPDGTTLNYGLEAMTNPVHEATERKRGRYRTKIFGNLAFVFHLADGLDLRTQVGWDANVRMNKDYLPNNMKNLSSRGVAAVYNGQNYYWQEETYLSYNKVFDVHRINATLGTSWSRYTYQNSNTSNIEDFATNFFGYDNLAAGLTPSAPTSNWEQWSMNSYFARASYGFKDKYLATLTLRIDGSSRFGANNKYGFFPSAGLGWVISNEDFMSGVSWINNLKLHTSYGRTGNTEIPVYRTLAVMSTGTTLLNGTRAPINEMERMPNPDLQWEKTDQFDIGVNFNVLKNRINLEMDYYYKKTSDLLLDRPLPFTTGFSSVWDNIGRVDNSGVDFLLSTVNIERTNFTWESTLNINYNQNEIKKLGANNEDIITNPDFVGGNVILRVGESLGSFYGYERLGTWSTAEAAQAAEINAVPGEAKRSKDRTIIGKGLPNWTGSFINKFYYKNWDLIIDLQFVTGVDVWQLFFHSAEDRTGIANGLNSILYDGWTETNQNTMIQQIRQQNWAGQNSNSDSHWVSDGSYLRGNLLQLGYTLSPQIVQKWGMQSLRVNFSVNNAFLIHSKDFKGYDPEGTSNTDRFGQNIIFYDYPSARTFTLGLNLSF